MIKYVVIPYVCLYALYLTILLRKEYFLINGKWLTSPLFTKNSQQSRSQRAKGTGCERVRKRAACAFSSCAPARPCGHLRRGRRRSALAAWVPRPPPPRPRQPRPPPRRLPLRQHTLQLLEPAQQMERRSRWRRLAARSPSSCASWHSALTRRGPQPPASATRVAGARAVEQTSGARAAHADQRRADQRRAAPQVCSLRGDRGGGAAHWHL